MIQTYGTCSIETALEFALNKHKGVTRKNKCGGIALPYIFHPLEVANLVWKWGAGNLDNMVAAIGHDLAEDCNCSYEELKEKLGSTPASIIWELSFFPKEGFTKEDYINSFNVKSIAAYVIKLADRFCNSKDFKLHDLKYAEKYFYKCSPLYDLFNHKSKQIIDAYGGDCFLKIKGSFEHMKNIIKSSEQDVIVPI